MNTDSGNIAWPCFKICQTTSRTLYTYVRIMHIMLNEVMSLHGLDLSI